MALVKCSECGNEISTKANACPKCGAATTKPSSFGVGTLIALLVMGWIVSELFGGSPTPPQRSAATWSPTPPAPPPEVTSEWPKIAASQVPSDVKLVSEIQKMSWHQACVAWGVAARANGPGRRSEALREFLLRDNSINGLDLGAVGARTVEVGMTACGTYAALGLPEDINTTTTATHTSQQLVYRSRSMYVYTESHAGNHNGVVRTIQR